MLHFKYEVVQGTAFVIYLSDLRSKEAKSSF
jgi:hypothetical protein